jgi:hypothetical protein
VRVSNIMWWVLFYATTAFHGNITSVEFDSGVHFQMWTFFSFDKFVRQHIHPKKKQNVRKHEVKKLMFKFHFIDYFLFSFFLFFNFKLRYLHEIDIVCLMCPAWVLCLHDAILAFYISLPCREMDIVSV